MIDETRPPSKHTGDEPIAAPGVKPGLSVEAPPDETHPKRGDPTFASPPPADGRTMVPNDANPVLAEPPPGEEPTLNAAPTDATISGHDSAREAYHKAAMAAAPKAVTTGASFGHYELIEPIAKGGMGIVYKARQRNLNRIVAIKMILAGQFADQSDIDRFYAEAEAAAALSHPNIVAIHEIGEVQGQHFFSMDYIEGQSLAALVQENPLRPRRAAEFVRTIAETMQFAHESGVVHRDLKPANILLDKRQRPLITDFGLAKQVTGQSQRTMAGSIVGTPSYMPPEQAAGKIDEIGPWSDLYSLGAILYELLTGRPPFRSASPFETVRQVLETDPLSPRLLNENVPKDLETICLKCLQKERVRRYASAQELADELGRFLRGEPIHARPISQIARFWRLCKRHPITASAIATAAVFFVAASIISTVAYVKTSAALAQSDQSFREAVNTVNELFTVASEETLLNQPGMQPVREKLLTKAKEYFERFSKQRADDPTVAFELAGAYFRLGRIAAMLQSPNDALKPYAKAREIQERLVAKLPSDAKRIEALGDTINFIGIARASLADFKGAHREFDEAVKLREQLVADSAGNSEYQRGLANTHMNIGVINRSTRDYAAARQQFEEAQRIRQESLAADPERDVAAKLRRDLGQGYFSLGRLDVDEQNFSTAVEHFKSAAALFEEFATENPEDLENQKNLTLVYRLLGDVLPDPDEARKWYGRALARIQPLSEQNPKVVDYPIEWAGVLANLFALELKAGNTADARAALQQARDILQRFPNVPRCQTDLVDTLRELASLQASAGENDAATKNLQDALTIVRGLVKQFGEEQFGATEAMTLRQLGSIEQGMAEHKSAIDHLTEATASMRRLAAKNPDANHQFELAVTLRALASAQDANGDAKASAASLDEAIRILTELVKQSPDDSEFKEQLEAAQKAALAASEK